MYFTTFQMDSLATKMIQFSKIPGSYALECDSTDALTDYTLRLVDMVWNVVKDHNDGLRTEYEPFSTDEEIPGEFIMLTNSTFDVDPPSLVTDETSISVDSDDSTLDEYCEVDWTQEHYDEFMAVKHIRKKIENEECDGSVSNPHKKTGRGGINRVEDPVARRARLDKRKAANGGDVVSKKNLFCPHGDGKNGEKEFKAGGNKITGCSYCCRTQQTMDKHIAKCNKRNQVYALQLRPSAFACPTDHVVGGANTDVPGY